MQKFTRAFCAILVALAAAAPAVAEGQPETPGGIAPIVRDAPTAPEATDDCAIGPDGSNAECGEGGQPRAEGDPRPAPDTDPGKVLPKA